MNRNNMSYSINPIINPTKNPINDKNVFYMQNSSIHENYWFQDLGNTIFNLDKSLKIFPSSNMTYPEKINSLVRLSIYMGLILGLFYKNYLFLYIPIIVMVLTYLLYIFRIDQLESLNANQGPNSSLNSINQKNLDDLKKHNMTTSYSYGRGNNSPENFKDILNIKTCSKPNTLNPFMNPLVFDSRLRDSACDSIKEENQLQIEKEYNKYCIKDVSDIFNHNSGRRQFYTVASTTYPNNQGGFANWLYKTPPTCKEGNGSQCIANYYTPLNGNLLTPGYGSKA
jgi:hypothetical protein